MLDRLIGWLQANPPEAMPYYPGAWCTGRVGLRNDRGVLEDGASPCHLGVDRTGGSRLVMPFDGMLDWSLTGGVAGSVLRLEPLDLPMQIQVFHTKGPGDDTLEMGRLMSAGETLPVMPGNLGLTVKDENGDGTHTHTEVLFLFDDEVCRWVTEGLPQIITDGEVDEQLIAAHCDTYGLVYDSFVGEVRRQARTWTIEQFWPRAAVRRVFPDYRRPPWDARTLIVDSLWLLQI